MPYAPGITYDTSGLARGIGQAAEGIAKGIETYRANQERDQSARGVIAGMLQDNPELIKSADEKTLSLLDKFKEGNTGLKDNIFLAGWAATADKQQKERDARALQAAQMAHFSAQAANEQAQAQARATALQEQAAQKAKFDQMNQFAQPNRVSATGVSAVPNGVLQFQGTRMANAAPAFVTSGISAAPVEISQFDNGTNFATPDDVSKQQMLAAIGAMGPQAYGSFTDNAATRLTPQKGVLADTRTGPASLGRMTTNVQTQGVPNAGAGVLSPGAQTRIQDQFNSPTMRAGLDLYNATGSIADDKAVAAHLDRMAATDAKIAEAKAKIAERDMLRSGVWKKEMLDGITAVRNDATGEIKFPPEKNVLSPAEQIQVKADSTDAEEESRSRAKFFDSVDTSGTESRKASQEFQSILDLYEAGATSGWGTQLATKSRQALRALGIPDKDLAKQEVQQVYINRAMQNGMRAYLKGDNSLSKNDRDLALAALANPNLSPAANIALIKVLKASADHDVALQDQRWALRDAGKKAPEVESALRKMQREAKLPSIREVLRSFETPAADPSLDADAAKYGSVLKKKP